MKPFQFTNCINYFRSLILNELHENNISCWIAGGCLRDYFSLGYISKDVDLFFSNEEEISKINTYLLEKKAKKLFENDNVMKFSYKNRIFDIVKKTFPSPKDCIKEFDFTVSCVAVDLEEVYYHESFFIDLAKKSIVINKITYPLSTLSRLQRYIKKGFTVCNGGLLEIANSFSNMNVKTMNEELEFYENGTPMFRGID
jgi:hypothetical protein